MQHLTLSRNFDDDLGLILSLIEQGASPSDVILESEAGMFATGVHRAKTPGIRIPAKLRDRLAYLSHHSGTDTWQIIFSVVHLWHTEGAARLSDLGHPIVIAAKKLSANLHYESHKLKAYLRFREVMTEDGLWYVSYHSCEHNVLPLVADFLRDRFRSICWQVSTRHCSARWDGRKITWGAGNQPSHERDALDELWRTFYKSTHNPDRLNTQLFKRHVPRKYWRDLPEIAAVGALLAENGHTNAPMFHVKNELGTPANLADLGKALDKCKRCELWQDTTQVVKGKGPGKAPVMIVGEQPGDQEDQQGEPFVGPAGQLLRQLSDAAGLKLNQCYITNAVKHFRFEQSTQGGKPRVHKRPGVTHISTCRSWLDAEIKLIGPTLIVCLGSTAVRGVVGYPVKMNENNNKILRRADGRAVLITNHPAAILRAEADRKDALEQGLVHGLEIAARWQNELTVLTPEQAPNGLKDQ